MCSSDLPDGPKMMRAVVRAVDPESLGVHPRQMRPVVAHEIVPHAVALDHLLAPVLAKRKDVRRGVLLLLVEAARFDADGVDDERGESEGHGQFGDGRGRGAAA